MKLIFVLLLFARASCCYAQGLATPQVKQFLNEFVNNNEKACNLYFEANPDSRLVDDLIKNLDDSVYRDMNNQKVAFILSPEEKEFIKEISLSQKNKEWDSTLLEHATILKVKRPGENFTREQAREYVQQFEGKYMIIFTIPVFLRNDTICIFLYVSYGGGTIYIMKKENQRWVKYLRKGIFVS